MAARALQRLAQRLAAAEACRGSAQLPACSAVLQRSLPGLLNNWLGVRPFSAQASELESSNGEDHAEAGHSEHNEALRTVNLPAGSLHVLPAHEQHAPGMEQPVPLDAAASTSEAQPSSPEDSQRVFQALAVPPEQAHERLGSAGSAAGPAGSPGVHPTPAASRAPSAGPERGAGPGSLHAAAQRPVPMPPQAAGSAGRPPPDGAMLPAGEVPSTPFRLQTMMATEARNLSTPGAAVALFEGYMRQHGVPIGGPATLPKHMQPNFNAWRVYIDALIRKPVREPWESAREQLPARLAKARAAIKEMEQRYHIPAPTLIFNDLLQSMQDLHGPRAAEAAFSIIDEMQDRDVARTRTTYLLAIHALAAKGYNFVEEALELVRRMVDEGLTGPEPTPNQVRRQAVEQLARDALPTLADQAATMMHFDGAFLALRCAAAMSLRVPVATLQKLLAGAVDQHRRDLLAQVMAMYDAQVQGMGTGVRGGHKPLWALDEGTLLSVLDAAAAAGDVASAATAWRHLEITLLPHDYRKASAPVPARSQARGGRSPPAAEPPAERDERFAALHAPPVVAYHAMIHAHSVAGDLKEAFRWVARLQRAYPGNEAAVAYQNSLSMLVDAAAQSPEAADKAYFELEGLRNAGEEVSTAMLDCVLAACAQMGDMARMLETMDSYPALGLKAGTPAFNVCMDGFTRNNLLNRIPFIYEDMKEAGVEWNATTHELAMDAAIVTRNVPGVMAALAAMRGAGFKPSARLMERVIQRLEREGAMEELMELDREDKGEARIAGTLAASSKIKRWTAVGSMRVLTGSPAFVSRPAQLRFAHERGPPRRGP